MFAAGTATIKVILNKTVHSIARNGKHNQTTLLRITGVRAQDFQTRAQITGIVMMEDMRMKLIQIKTQMMVQMMVQMVILMVILMMEEEDTAIKEVEKDKITMVPSIKGGLAISVKS